MKPDESSPNYQICFEGQLDDRWLRSFEGVNLVWRSNGEMLICGHMDQATLHGILNRIRDLGLKLISVQRNAPSDF